MTVETFPDLSAELTQFEARGGGGGPPSTAILTVAANRITEVHDYLYHSNEPTSSANMVQLRDFLQHIDGYLTSVTAYQGLTNGDDTGSRDVTEEVEADDTDQNTDKDILGAGEAVRETIKAARISCRVMNKLADKWAIYDRIRDRPLERIDSDYAALLKRQQELETSLSVLAKRLHSFVKTVAEIGQSGSAPPASRSPNHGLARKRGIEERLHYIPWQHGIANRAG